MSISKVKEVKQSVSNLSGWMRILFALDESQSVFYKQPTLLTTVVWSETTFQSKCTRVCNVV